MDLERDPDPQALHLLLGALEPDPPKVLGWKQQGSGCIRPAHCLYFRAESSLSKGQPPWPDGSPALAGPGLCGEGVAVGWPQSPCLTAEGPHSCPGHWGLPDSWPGPQPPRPPQPLGGLWDLQGPQKDPNRLVGAGLQRSHRQLWSQVLGRRPAHPRAEAPSLGSRHCDLLGHKSYCGARGVAFHSIC